MWRWFNSLTFRLTGTLLVAVSVVLAVTAALQVTLQYRYARHCAHINGLALSEGLFGALHSAMLANDRPQLRQAMRSINQHSPNLRVRIFNKEGRIAFSSRAGEVGNQLNFEAEACYKCHASERPIEHLPMTDRTRSFELDGRPALGIIRPILNESSCSATSCHPSVTEKRLLGVLDTTLIMGPAQQAQKQTTALMLAAWGAALALIVAVVVVVVRRAVYRPVSGLTRTLDAIGEGDLSARYEERHINDFDHLGTALNRTAQQLQRANAELTQWTTTLERRVEEKTAELQRAQQQMLRAERLASLGRLAAVVAHEINNPLASVLTYARLLKRRQQQDPAALASADSSEILDAIANESRRCGDIVTSLLSFARGTGKGPGPSDVNEAVDKALFLVKHKLSLAGVRVATELGQSLPLIACNGDQLQQALLALFVNAVDAMADGGLLMVRTRAEGDTVVIEVADTGCGVPAAVQARMFEPFFTTKGQDSSSTGLGLGLTVVEGIVHENDGTVAVESEPGEGTCFRLTMPRADQEAAATAAAAVISLGEGSRDAE